MIKEARYVDDALNGPINEPQPVALKATRSKEALPSKVAQVEAAGLNDEEMASSSSASRRRLKVARDSQARPSQRGSAHASNVVSLVILLLTVPIMIVTRKKETRGKRRRITRRPRARHISERSGIRIAPPPTPTMKDSPPLPSTSHPSSPTSITHASWRRRRRYVLGIPLMLLQVMILVMTMR
jgi:hypothetical protein